MNRNREGEIGRRQANDFLNQLESEGVSSEHLQHAQENKALRAKIAGLLISPKYFEETGDEDELIHGRFVSCEKQVELQWNWNRKRGYYALAKAYFDRLGEPPAWPEDELCAVVLDVGLDTIRQTFEEAWTWIIESQNDHNGGHWRWNSIKSDRDHLRLHGGRSHERGLRWRVIDFAAHWDKKNGIRPQDVRSANSPDSACLWAASYFPKYVQAMDGENIPYMWLPGYELNVDGGTPWSYVPSLSWGRVNRGVGLGASFAGSRSRHWAVPSLREC